MGNEEKKKNIVVELNQSFHPFEDKTLIETQPGPPTINTREPFNDYIKHKDIIAGYQQNRTLSDYPRRMRPWVRFYAIATLVLFVVGILWDVLH